MKETKQIPVGIPSFLNNIYRLLGYEDNSSRNSPESKQQYSSAFKELKKELIGDVVDNNMLTVHFFNAPYGEVNADKTLDEMLEAIAQGKNMVGYYEYNLYGDTLIMRPSFYNLENKRITFSGINVGSSGVPIDILLFDFKRTGSSIGTRIRQTI